MQLRFGLLIGAVFLLFAAGSTPSRSACRGCNVVDEGIFGRHLIGTYLYEQGAEGRFYRMYVEDVSMAPKAVYRRILTGKMAWNTATAFYSEPRMREVVADGGRYRMTEVDRQQQSGVLAACAAFLAARKDGRTGEAWLMRRGCCESSASSKYAPPGVCVP